MPIALSPLELGRSCSHSNFIGAGTEWNKVGACHIFLPKKRQAETYPLCEGLRIGELGWVEKKKSKLLVRGADRSEPLLGFYFERRHWAKGCLWLGSRLGAAGLGEVFKYGALLPCSSTSAPLALAPFTAFMAILGHCKEKKKKKSSLLWICHGWGRERVMCQFWNCPGQSFVCCLGRAPRIEGNTVVLSLASFSPSCPPQPLFLPVICLGWKSASQIL